MWHIRYTSADSLWAATACLGTVSVGHIRYTSANSPQPVQQSWYSYLATLPHALLPHLPASVVRAARTPALPLAVALQVVSLLPPPLPPPQQGRVGTATWLSYSLTPPCPSKAKWAGPHGSATAICPVFPRSCSGSAAPGHQGYCHHGSCAAGSGLGPGAPPASPRGPAWGVGVGAKGGGR